MKAALQQVRLMAITGRHLYHSMADEGVRREGWSLMMRAKRIARRLGYSLRAVGVDF